MICSLCNGEVTWRGPLSDLTHTECSDCGGLNCQVPEPYQSDAEHEREGDGDDWFHDSDMESR